MDPTEIYSYFLHRVHADLSDYGYSRSGNNALFYRYSADKKVACSIEMQKSAFNFPGNYSFTFNLISVGLFQLQGYTKDKLTIAAIKACFRDLRIVKRIGTLRRGCDYWWNITDEILSTYSLEEYYDRFMQADIKAAAAYLDTLAEAKNRVYQ